MLLAPGVKPRLPPARARGEKCGCGPGAFRDTLAPVKTMMMDATQLDPTRAMMQQRSSQIVAIQDANGNTVTSQPGTSVTLSKVSGPGTLSCTNTTVTSVSGVATFARQRPTLPQRPRSRKWNRWIYRAKNPRARRMFGERIPSQRQSNRVLNLDGDGNPDLMVAWSTACPQQWVYTYLALLYRPGA